ncbi:MAG: hypothetical protein ACTSPI_00305 [Candidatus Heimdallarchaeaceae archaeon]
MSKEDPKEHIKTYELFCAPRFSTLEDDIKETTKAVNRLNAILTNGLQERVKYLEKNNRWVVRLLVSLLLAIIASTITLLLKGNI